MIKSSRTAAITAGLFATTLHAAYLFVPTNEQDAQIAGGAASAAAAIGNAFTDLAVGTNVPDVLEVQEAEPVSNAAPFEDVKQQSEAAKQVQEPMEVSSGQSIQKPFETLQPSELETTSQPSATNTTTPSTPTHAQSPIAAETSQTKDAKETRRADVEHKTSSVEPAGQVRESFKNETAQKPVEQTVKPRGNAAINAQKGADNGAKNQKAAESSTTSSQTKAAGNAAITNYKGKVFRKISRAKRSKVKIRGAVRVSLTIGPNGALVDVRVSKSSGSAKLDQVAVAQVKRAAPFEPTPDGRGLRFDISIKGS